MSSPTPGSDPNVPQGGAPHGQPAWGAPPPPAPGHGTSGYGASGYGASGYGTSGYEPAPAYSGGPVGSTRPGTVTAAAVIGIVIGALGLLSVFSIGTLFDFDAVLGLLSLLSLATAAVVLIGGIQAIQDRSPRLLLLGSYGSIAVQLLTLIWAAVTGYGFLFFGLIGFVLPGLIIFFLLQPQAKQYYASRGISY